MFNQQVYIINTALIALDGLCVIAAGYGADWLVFQAFDGLKSPPPQHLVWLILLVMVANHFAMSRIGLYSDRRPGSVAELLGMIFKAVLVSFVVLSSALFFWQDAVGSRTFLTTFAGLSLAYLGALRLAARAWADRIARNRRYSRRLLVVGDPGRVEAVVEALDRQISWGHRVVGQLGVGEPVAGTPLCLGTLADLPRVLRSDEIDEVVFALSGDRGVDLKPHVETCRKMGIRARILLGLWEPGAQGVALERVQGMPFLTVHAHAINASGMLYKRVLDLVGGVVGTLVFLALYPLVALAIKRESPGPVLFRQKRVGKNGRIFGLYKFRSMYVDAEARKAELMAQNEMQGAMFKMKNDPRITRVGAFLRKTSLDEFPQFLNVLAGDMSLVGTRPPTLDEVATYDTWHLRRISEKPGITGLWQVSGRNAITDFDEVAKLDCRYLERWRFRDDLKILLQTVLVVFQRRGAV